MGLDIHGVRLQLLSKKIGIDFKDVVTIGRQGLNVTQKQIQKEFENFGIPHYSKKIVLDEYCYSEPLFELLGARKVESIDNSDYENATIIHDMNNPIPESLKSKFSVVVDAGTLEHVFNYPVALKNCMELLKTGGVFISITPANNFMGHGFYQFSPELFFSVFNKIHGFELVKLLICETYEEAKWYEVSKPKGGNVGRVTLINNEPTYLMCIARRLDEKCEPLKITPQQSDYVEAWNEQPLQLENRGNGAARRNSLLGNSKATLKHYLQGILPLIRLYRYLRKPLFNSRDYKLFDVSDSKNL